MQDLEDRLAAIGYRPVQKSAECWQVLRIGATPPPPRMPPAPQQRDPAYSPALRFWLGRTGRFEPSSLYRIRRAM
jgi:hypothetical protein